MKNDQKQFFIISIAKKLFFVLTFNFQRTMSKIVHVFHQLSSKMVTFDIVLPLEESCPDTLDLNLEKEEINWGHPCNPNVNIVLILLKK